MTKIGAATSDAQAAPSGVPVLRRAEPSDAGAIEALMRSSILDMFPQYYDERQTMSCAVHVAHVDVTLIEDGTFLVLEVDGEIVACGGWSRRGRLYTGSSSTEGDDRFLDPRTEPAHLRAMFVRSDWRRRGLARMIFDASRKAALEEGFRSLDLMATLPGVPFYRSCGFRDVETCAPTTADGVPIQCVRMERPI